MQASLSTRPTCRFALSFTTSDYALVHVFLSPSQIIYTAEEMTHTAFVFVYLPSQHFTVSIMRPVSKSSKPRAFLFLGFRHSSAVSGQNQELSSFRV